MKIDIEFILIAVAFLIFADVILLLRLLINKAKDALKLIQKREEPKEKNLIRALRSPFKTKRIKAAVELGIIGSSEARKALEEALTREKDFPVRLYLANALTDIGVETSLPLLIESLVGSHRWYRTKVNLLIATFGAKLEAYIPDLLTRKEEAIKELLVDLSASYISGDLKEYVFRLIEEDEVLAEKAAEAVSVFYFNELATDRYLSHKNPVVRNIAVRALGGVDKKESFYQLKELLVDPIVSQTARHAIAQLIDKDPTYIRMTLDAFREETTETVKEQLAEALSGRIEYFIMKLSTYEKEDAEKIIKQLIYLGKTSELIGFLNKNKEIEMENKLLSIVKEAVAGREAIEKEFCTYLHDRLLKKAGLVKCERLRSQKEKARDPVFIRILYFLLTITLIFFPIAYLLINLPMLFVWPPLLHLKIYVLDYNYFLVFYSLLINFIYLALLFFSRINVV
ncbi:MAG: HEAT repeat domain-containing protein, partial [Eubacteriales bacterium]|nr:HEAT repeat domain-containing protein [Eubacteriales bacterium]